MLLRLGIGIGIGMLMDIDMSMAGIAMLGRVCEINGPTKIISIANRLTQAPCRALLDLLRVRWIGSWVTVMPIKGRKLRGVIIQQSCATIQW